MRTASFLIAFVLLPVVAIVHFTGRWDFSATGFNRQDQWWMIPIYASDKVTVLKHFNILTCILVLSLLYIGASILAYVLSLYYKLKKEHHLLAIHRVLLKLGILLICTIVYLSSQGVSLTPLWVGMGAASVIVGIALREPLSSLFKGIALDVEGVFRRGEWIQVGGEGGVTGKVVEKNWRTTRIMTIHDELITIPNNVLGSETILNFNQPDPAHVHRLYVGTTYNDPPVKVKEILRTILMRHPRIENDPVPQVRTIKYNDFSIDYELKFWIRDYGEFPRIYDEVMTQIWYAFKFYGIEIPFPIRTVHMKEQEHLARDQKAILEQVDDIKEFLQSLSFLSDHLNYRDIDFLARNAFQRRYNPGEHVIHRGEMGDALYIVREGGFEVVLPNNERRRIDPGEYFGEMGLTSREPRTADVVAGQDGGVTIRVDRECFHTLFKRYPALAETILEVRDARKVDAGMVTERVAVKPITFAEKTYRRLKDFLIPW